MIPQDSEILQRIPNPQSAEDGLFARSEIQQVANVVRSLGAEPESTEGESTP